MLVVVKGVDNIEVKKFIIEVVIRVFDILSYRVVVLVKKGWGGNEYVIKKVNGLVINNVKFSCCVIGVLYDNVRKFLE